MPLAVAKSPPKEPDSANLDIKVGQQDKDKVLSESTEHTDSIRGSGSREESSPHRQNLLQAIRGTEHPVEIGTEDSREQPSPITEGGTQSDSPVSNTLGQTEL